MSFSITIAQVSTDGGMWTGHGFATPPGPPRLGGWYTVDSYGAESHCRSARALREGVRIEPAVPGDAERRHADAGHQHCPGSPGRHVDRSLGLEPARRLEGHQSEEERPLLAVRRTQPAPRRCGRAAGGQGLRVLPELHLVLGQVRAFELLPRGD